ncbi:MAG: hypothetical protein K9J85_10890 [Desulfobacteraceae bacterium]|nr:hypothetical protein [Desulfobacteraceae bacterium]
MQKYFDFFDNQINDLLRVDVGFSSLPAAEIYQMGPGVLEGFKTRYEVIKQFQQVTASLFNASLQGDMDPEIARLIVNELPDSHGLEHHKDLHDHAAKMSKDITPVFFRTDETVPGKISEIQPPGSLWCTFEQFYLFYRHFERDFKAGSVFEQPLSRKFVESLRDYLPFEPVVHHLMDNASVPAGMRFFLQRTRQHGMKYYGYDRDVTAYDCNFFRAHAFQGLMADNYLAGRFSAWKKGLAEYDLPPSIVFDEKLPMIFPFWEKTRAWYPDEVREIFPYTCLITPDGFELEDGCHISLDQFFDLPRSHRPYYFKYAGSNLAFNWGSKGVYYAGMLSRPGMEELKTRILRDYGLGKYWILQKKHAIKENISYMDRDEEIKKDNATAKFSGFYGPNGLMAVLVMHRPFHKVHGTRRTVVSIC